jgi:hypoxia up-regulated 1
MMGIDLGTEYFKVTVIKPGKPFMMLENLLSKTKTELVAGLKEDEITYAYDALAKKAKAPANIFNYFSEFLGRRHNDSFVKEYMEDFFQSYNISADNETETITFNFKFNNKDEQLSVVELYSMIFDYIKSLSEKFTKIEMTDAFVTIPSFFDYQQRQAIADAIKISKLRLAGVVSENLAAAVQFQLKKVFDNETFYIIYNMGSSYTQVSLISFKTIYEMKNNKSVDIGNEIKIYGESYNEKLGGKRFDKNLCLLMMKKFDELPIRKGKKSVIGNRKIYEKIRPSAIKYKEVLSANKEAYITVIGVEGGDDLQTKITREEFEEVNKDIIDKVYEPIEDVLKKTNMTINNISQIELIGGSIRIPAIQEEIKKKLGENSEILGIHMNGDDSMAFGAAYMCANSSKNFLGSRKTFMNNGANEKFKFYLSNLENKTSPFKYCKEEEIASDSKPKDCVRKLEREKEIFPLRHRYNSKRSIEIEQDTNILVKITEEYPGKFQERDLKTFEITGVPEAIKQMKDDNSTATLPKINIRFIYTKGGQIELESYIKYKYPKYFCEDFYYIKNYTEPLPKEEIDKINDILNKSVVLSEYEMKELIKNVTSKNKTENETNDEDEYEEVDYDDYDDYDEDDFYNQNKTDEKNETNKNGTKENLKKLKKRKIKKYKPTPANYTYNNTLYITTEEKKRLKNLKKIGQKKDEEKTIYLDIKENHLIYPHPMNETQVSQSLKKIKRFIEIDKNRTKLIEQKNKLEALIFSRKEWLDSEHAKRYLKPGELDNSTIFINNKSLWYEDDGYAATYEVLEKEIRNITNYFREFERRQRRHYERLNAINKFFTDLNSTQQRVVKALTDKPWTEEYFNTTFLKEYNETMEWFNKTYTKQEMTPHWEPEVLSPYMLNRKMDNLRQLLYEMTTMKNLTKEEREKEKEKKKKEKEKRKKKNKIGDIDLDDILNKNGDDLDDLFRKMNISKEEFEKKILNDTENTNKTSDSNKEKKDNKKETDL